MTLHVRTAALSDPGCERSENEDAVLCVDGKAVTLIVVADGLGGHRGGSVASVLATTAIANAVTQGSGPLAGRLARGIEAANATIYRCGRRLEALRGMGTTCAALAIADDEAVCAHVGDSRVYLLRGGGLYAMTEDHSWVQELVRQGAITPDEARHHETRHVLGRAIGTRREVTAAIWPRPLRLRDGDRFLICSDGLYTMVSEAELSACGRVLDPSIAVRRLVALACGRGAPDNVTVAIAAVSQQH